MCIGDVFKLSTHIVRVADIRTTRRVPEIFKKKQYVMGHNREEVVCRVCYESSSTADNPILAPCRCQGSVRYLHADCLKKSVMASPSYKSTPTRLRVTRDALMCTICKQ